MATDILNQHAEVAIQDEMHAKTLEAYFNFLGTVQSTFDHYSAIKAVSLDAHWRRSQSSLHHAFFAAANKTGDVTQDKSGIVRYHGIKTPGFERYFKQFDSMFSKSRPHYVYCVRDVGPVWRSWLTREFTDDIEIFKMRYERSLRQALLIKRQAPDRFSLFDLDEFISSTNPDAFVEDSLFRPLDLSKADTPTVTSLQNTNSAAARGLTLVSPPNLADQLSFLREDPKIKDYKEQLRSS